MVCIGWYSKHAAEFSMFRMSGNVERRPERAEFKRFWYDKTNQIEIFGLFIDFCVPPLLLELTDLVVCYSGIWLSPNPKYWLFGVLKFAGYESALAKKKCTFVLLGKSFGCYKLKKCLCGVSLIASVHTSVLL